MATALCSGGAVGSGSKRAARSQRSRTLLRAKGVAPRIAVSATTATKKIDSRLCPTRGARGMRQGAGRLTASASERDVAGLWAAAEVVCFDVDSTVCASEGIDDLAAYLGKGEEVARFTAEAMTGSIPFEEALSARLAIIKPSKGSIETFLQEVSSRPSLSPPLLNAVSPVTYPPPQERIADPTRMI